MLNDGIMVTHILAKQAIKKYLRICNLRLKLLLLLTMMTVCILLQQRPRKDVLNATAIRQRQLQNDMIQSQEINMTLTLAGTLKHGASLPRLTDVLTVPSSPSVAEFLSKPIINPHPYGYYHNTETACGTNKTKLLFVIPSAPDNFDQRKWVRNSDLWKFVKKYSTNVSLLFFLGLPSYKGAETHHIQLVVNYESAVFKDIVQANFTDKYHDILLKAQLMLKWASTYCYNATYVIRSDDDITFDVEKIVNTILETGRRYRDVNFILGSVKSKYRVARSGDGEKNDVSFEDYPGEFWPPFALGGLLGYPLRSVRLLYEASLRQKAIWLDDVYITAMCAPRVNVTLLDDTRWRMFHTPPGLHEYI